MSGGFGGRIDIWGKFLVVVPNVEKNMVTKKNVRIFSSVLLGLGFFSILASLFTWFRAKSTSPSHDELSEGQRFGLFIGLWPPTFFILSNLVGRLAEESNQIPE
jgi:hypothetical protein